MFRRAFIIGMALLSAAGCNSVHTKLNPGDLVKGIEFSKTYQAPLDIQVAFYTPAARQVNNVQVTHDGQAHPYDSGDEFVPPIEDAFSLYFRQSAPLTPSQSFDLLYKLIFSLNIDTFTGAYEATVQADVYDPNGAKIYSGTGNSRLFSAITTDYNAIYNAFLKAASNVIEESLLQIGPVQVANMSADTATTSDADRFQPTRDYLEIAGTGTAFYINERGEMLTAYHVVNKCAGMTVGINGNPVPAKVVASDRFVDLAVITANVTPKAYVSLPAQEEPKLGEQVIVLGYPLSQILSNSPNLTTGNISSLSGLQGDNKVLQLSAPIQPGNSGGPAINANGQLLGVVNSTLNSLAVAKATGNVPQNVNFAIKARILKRFLDANQIPYKVSEQAEARGLGDLTQELQDYTVQVACHG